MPLEGFRLSMISGDFCLPNSILDNHLQVVRKPSLIYNGKSLVRKLRRQKRQPNKCEELSSKYIKYLLEKYNDEIKEEYFLLITKSS